MSTLLLCSRTLEKIHNRCPMTRIGLFIGLCRQYFESKIFFEPFFVKLQEICFVKMHKSDPAETYDTSVFSFPSNYEGNNARTSIKPQKGFFYQGQWEKLFN